MSERKNVESVAGTNRGDVASPGKPIRIAQVLNRMDSGGVEAVVLNYYRHIDRNQVQFDFYFAEGSSLPQRNELEQLGAGLYPVPAYSHPIAYHKALRAAFKRHDYRIVHAHLSTMSLFPLFAAWRAGVPARICHNHSTAHKGEGLKTVLKYLLRPFNRLFATDWFACGETAGRWMYGDKAFDASRVTVMPNAIDTAKFAYDPQARIALREELGIPQDAFVVGHVGRYMYQKNHSFLLDIFAELLKQRKNAVLLLIGEGELEEEIHEKAQVLGITRNVMFAGVRRDVNKLYSVMDVFCLPSFYEGMPVVAWEAQANGLFCVFADTITREAGQKERLPFLSLDAAPGLWAETILTGSEREKITVPDIHECAGDIQDFYTSECRQCC